LDFQRNEQKKHSQSKDSLFMAIMKILEVVEDPVFV
jgi:hypothetical protein